MWSGMLTHGRLWRSCEPATTVPSTHGKRLLHPESTGDVNRTKRAKFVPKHNLPFFGTQIANHDPTIHGEVQKFFRGSAQFAPLLGSICACLGRNSYRQDLQSQKRKVLIRTPINKRGIMLRCNFNSFSSIHTTCAFGMLILLYWLPAYPTVQY